MPNHETLRVGDRFRSNGGSGPWTARIVEIKRGTVHLQRVLGDGHLFRRQVQYSRLPVTFFSSQACGWKRILEDATDAGR